MDGRRSTITLECFLRTWSSHCSFQQCSCRTASVPRMTDLQLNHIEAQCVAKGMRMTEQRRVIARVLAGSEDHPDVEELFRRCALIDNRISISTVYRTVKLF